MHQIKTQHEWIQIIGSSFIFYKHDMQKKHLQGKGKYEYHPNVVMWVIFITTSFKADYFCTVRNSVYRVHLCLVSTLQI